MTVTEPKKTSMKESRILHKSHCEDFSTDYHLRELRLIVDVINLKKGKILDVGCGNGLIHQFLPQTLDYIGIDFNDSYLTITWMGEAKSSKIVGDITHLPFCDDVFDIVLNLHVIEHLPKNTLQEKLVLEISRVLKEGGQLIISTPNLGTFSNAHYFIPPRNPKHFNCLTYSEMINILSQSGFRNIKRLGFDIIVEYPHKIFKLIPYTFRRLIARCIIGFDKHLIVQAYNLPKKLT